MSFVDTNNKKPLISVRTRILAILGGTLVPVMGVIICIYEIDRMISASRADTILMESSAK